MTAEAMVHVVDDDPASREAMAALLDSVALPHRCHAGGTQFLAALDPERPDCAILDLRMADMSGLELQTALREQHTDLPVIFLTGHAQTKSVVQAMRGGALDFLTKPVDNEVLLARAAEALERARLAHQVRCQRRWVRKLIHGLTPREHEVLEAVVRGLSNKGIARELEISYKTVELHRAHMMEKMDAHSIAEVVQLYLFARDRPIDGY